MKNIYSGKYKKFVLPPLALFIIFLATVLVWPGITPGLDLVGGTLLIVDTPSPVDSESAANFLEEEFVLVDLKTNSISSPLGNRLRIEFVENRTLAETAEQLQLASSLLEQHPEQSKQHSLAVLQKNQEFVGDPYSESDSAEKLLALARDSALKEKEHFNSSIKQKLSERFGLPEGVAMQSEEIHPVLGQLFWQGALWVGIIGIILITIVIFGFFREILPSFAIVFAAAFDALAALAAMSIFSIPLGLATIPTILLLLGYSIDTNILLTTRVLHRKDSTPRNRAFESMVTGLTMTATAISAVLVMLVFAYFLQIDVMFTIAFLLFFGLAADIIVTWLLNAPMLLWYAEKKFAVVE